MLGQLVGHKAHGHHIKAACREVGVLSFTVQEGQGLSTT